MTGRTSICALWASCSAIATTRHTTCCRCSALPMIRWSAKSPRRARVWPGCADSTRRASTPRYGRWIFRITIRWSRTAPRYWSVDTVNPTLVEKLARLRGVGDAYHDYRGDLRYFSLKTKTDILRAMGCSVDDPAALAADLREAEIARFRRLLPSIASARGARAGIDLNISARDFGASLVWTVNLEAGSHREDAVSTAACREIWRGEVDGSWITRRRLELPVDLPPGYHELEVKIASVVTRCLLVVSPPECFEPAAIVSGRRVWGMAVQLYTVRSRDNWGIGDFGDLQSLIRWLAPHGAGFIGLNPLHALAPADPVRSSPYSASSRHFLHILYIAVPLVPDFAECARARAAVDEHKFQERLQGLRSASLVDYRGVADAKFGVLELLFHHFRDQHLNPATDRGQRFRAFVAGGGRCREAHARFDALDQHFRP